jgi:hypothetical protein
VPIQDGGATRMPMILIPGKAAGIFCASGHDAPSIHGAYVLAVELMRLMTVALPGKRHLTQLGFIKSHSCY